ncbi:MAG: ribosomal-processing cysteine protease Prp [Oscillospiraceae bacterium]|nr:ribosomal-processing cysteine protease Prp [Oscillospiraceae bacterium]
MIVVKYNRRDTVMSVKGHAGSAVKGRDLVCAAASILGLTLIAAAMDSREKYLPAVTQREGEIRVACRPKGRGTALCRRMMDTIFTGYELLSGQYPDFVRAQRED